MKKWTKTLLLTAILTTGLSMPAMAANVQATLPTFPVTLNGTVIDNTNRQYPLLVYNNITYFPMTYYDCRFLGVETEWTKANGLTIKKSNLTGAYHQESGTKNSKKATAQLATGKIAVNGKAITNSKEQYPLLVYRDVTYFPLTWRFAVEEFGWKYNYDNKNGLVIDAGNAKTKSVTLADARKAEYDYDIFGFAIDKQYLYYQGEKGAVYRRPLASWNDDKQRKKVAEIPYENFYNTGYYQASFWEESNHVYLGYHSGGATMGHNVHLRLSADGTSDNLLKYQYDAFHDFGDFQIRIDGMAIGGAPAVPMTYIAKDGSEKAVGAEGYCYQINNSGYDQKRNQLYVSAYQRKDDTGNAGKSYLYAVNLNTNATIKLSEKAASGYQYANDRLYYLSSAKLEGIDHTDNTTHYLYALDLDTKKEQSLGVAGHSSKNNEGMYAAASNGVYYRNGENGNLQFWNKHTGKTETINTGFQVTGLYSQNGYVIAHFAETAKNPHRLMVFAPSGKAMQQVYATADCSDKAVINASGLLVYRLENTNQLVQVQL